MTYIELDALQARIEVLFGDAHAEACGMNFVFGWLLSAVEAGRKIDPQTLLDAMLERAEQVHARSAH